MAKSKDAKKNVKKEAILTPKEKKAVVPKAAGITKEAEMKVMKRTKTLEKILEPQRALIFTPELQKLLRLGCLCLYLKAMKYKPAQGQALVLKRSCA